MIPIWQRYFCKEYTKSILAILVCIMGIYAIVDLCVHTGTVLRHPYPLVWATYYVAVFLKQYELLLPFAVLLATIRTLHHFQQRGELIALLTGGISKRGLLQPLFIITLFALLTVYGNFQYTLPWACATIDEIETTQFKKEVLQDDSPKELFLNDGTKLIFSRYDKKTKTFYSAFWIVSVNKIYYMKQITLSDPPKGKFVDHMIRSKDGVFEKVASLPEFPMKWLKISEESIARSTTPMNAQSLSELAQQATALYSSSSSKAAEIKSVFLYKIVIPFLTLFAFIAPAPFCLQWTRNFPLLLIYLIALAALFCTHIVIQVAVILGKHQVTSPWTAFGIPVFALASLFSRRYRRTA